MISPYRVLVPVSVARPGEGHLLAVDECFGVHRDDAREAVVPGMAVQSAVRLEQAVGQAVDPGGPAERDEVALARHALVDVDQESPVRRLLVERHGGVFRGPVRGQIQRVPAFQVDGRMRHGLFFRTAAVVR